MAIATLPATPCIPGFSILIPPILRTPRMADEVCAKKGRPSAALPDFPSCRCELDLSHAAVNVDLNASNVRSVLRSEKCDCASHLFRLSKPLHRNFRHYFLREFIDRFF